MSLETQTNITETKKDPYKFSRLMYIFEAAFEYFVSIAVGTVYLARVTTYIGMSDTLTGILSSFVSLGCGFQIISIFLANKRPQKPFVTVLHLISQLAFTFIYVVPLVELSTVAKTVIFVFLLLLAQVLHNVVNSPKINWFMSLVDDDKRGRFTSNKEIVSLISGMVFSFAMGSIMDHFEAKGDMRNAFLFCAIGIFGLTVLHTATLLLSKEKTEEMTENVNIKEQLSYLVKDKTVLKIILITVIWNIAYYAIVPFTGTYQAKELGFSTTLSSVIIIVGCFIRALFSRPMGKFADKHGFANMLLIAYSIACVSFFINIFTSPKNGIVLYPIYEILSHIAAAGINSAVINLVYDYVDSSHRTTAMALQNTFGGFAGFFVTLMFSPVLSFMQARGNKILGITVYAQQILSLVSFVITVFLLIYIKKVIMKLNRVNK